MALRASRRSTSWKRSRPAIEPALTSPSGSARTAGATLAGKEVPYDAVPWFWSDQYDLRLQMCGLSTGHDAHCVRGDRAANKFSVFYFKAGRSVAVDSVNASAEHMLARKLVAGRVGCGVEQAGDAAFDLKALLSR